MARKGAREVARLRVKVEPDASGFGRGLEAELNRQEGHASGLIAKWGARAAVAGGAAVAAVATKSLLDFSGFERQMNEVFTLLPDISGKAMSDMTSQVKAFSREFGLLPDQVVPALYQAISAGVPQDNVFEFLKVAQKAAKGGVTELTTAVDGISSVVNAYGADVISAAQASDLMFTAVRLGKTNFDELSRSLFNVTPTAAALGVKFGDVTAALAAMTAQGVPTSVATTQLRQLLVELSKDGSKAAGIFEAAWGGSFQAFIAQGGNVKGALDVLVGASATTGTALQDMFGSVEAGSAALSLTGSQKFGDSLAEMANSAGATDKAFEQMNRGIGPLMDKIRANAAVRLLDIGDFLANRVIMPAVERWGPAVSRAMTQVGGGLRQAFGLLFKGDFVGGGPFQEDSPFVVGLLRTREIARNVFGMIRDFVNAAVQRIRSFLAQNRATFDEWGAKLQEVFGQVQETAKAWWAAVQVLFATGVKVVSALWERFGDDIWRHISGTVSRVIDILSGAFRIIQGVYEVFAGLFSGDWAKLWQGVKSIFSGAWDVLTGLVRQLLANWQSIFEVGLGLIQVAWSWAWNGIKTLASDIWDGIKSSISSGIDSVVGWFEAMPGRLREAAGDLFGFLRDAFKSAINFVIRGWNSLEFKIPGFDPPGPGPKFGGFTLGVPDIPELAEGGRATRGGLAMVGENGPELATLNIGAQVVPLDVAAMIAEAAGGNREPTTRIVQVYNPVPEPASKTLAALAQDDAAQAAGW